MTVLLVIIYLSFISLGLPDSLLGSAWTTIQIDMGAQFALAGIVSMVISGGTIVSSLISNRVIFKFGTGKVTLFSVMMTAAALFGISVAQNIYVIMLMAVPLGIGAGAVDAALNNFVALHYKSRHMSWLHCFWGIGATAGPAIMSAFLVAQGGWRKGYALITFIQLLLVAVLIATQKFWKKANKQSEIQNFKANENEKFISNRQVLKTKHIKYALIAFLFLCATELTTGLWASSYLVKTKELDASTAALWAAYFYGGITFGRFVSGVVSTKLSSKILIRSGQLMSFMGTILMILPANATASMVGLVLIGIGIAPIFPCMLHETPKRFGKERSQAIMGLQMAFAYIGSTFMPPLFGGIASISTLRIFPIFLMVCIIIMFLASERLESKLKKES